MLFTHSIYKAMTVVKVALNSGIKVVDTLFSKDSSTVEMLCKN